MLYALILLPFFTTYPGYPRCGTRGRIGGNVRVVMVGRVSLSQSPSFSPLLNGGARSKRSPKMVRMLGIGYVFVIRSERALCRDVQANLAYRWFCGLSIEDKIPDHSVFSRARNERFRAAFSRLRLRADRLRLVECAVVRGRVPPRRGRAAASARS